MSPIIYLLLNRRSLSGSVGAKHVSKSSHEVVGTSWYAGSTQVSYFSGKPDKKRFWSKLEHHTANRIMEAVKIHICYKGTDVVRLNSPPSTKGIVFGAR